MEKLNQDIHLYLYSFINDKISMNKKQAGRYGISLEMLLEIQHRINWIPNYSTALPSALIKVMQRKV